MLSLVDWNRPWLKPFRKFNSIAKDADHWRCALNDLAIHKDLRNQQALSVRFADQSELPRHVAYETFIYETGCIPTRENLHDFFNAMVWLCYPRSKAVLNQLQAIEIARQLNLVEQLTVKSTPAIRGAVRDRATIFDENAAFLLVSNKAIEEDLRQRKWHELLLERRFSYGVTWEVHLFGHALIEKLVTPFKSITAHVWILEVDLTFLRLDIEQKALAMDQLISQKLAQNFLNTVPTPLPVLGVPGWWVDQSAAFYADATVFRR
jgi:hypothetical protein